MTRIPRIWTLPRSVVAAGLGLVMACSGPARRAPAPEETPLEGPFPPRPQVDAAIEVQVPRPVQRLLRGEVQLAAVERRHVPAVWFRWVLPGGRALETLPGAKPGTKRFPQGTLSVLASLLTEGTRRHPGEQFAAAVKSLGGDVTVSALGDGMLIQGQVLSHNLGPMLVLIRELVQEPELSPRALATLQQQLRAELANESADAEAVAARLARQLLYGEHPYGWSGPNEDSVGKITLAHLADAHKAALQLGQSQLVAVGDLDPAELGESVEKVFGYLLDTPPMLVPLAAPRFAAQPGCHVVDMPAATQTSIVQLAGGVARNTAGYEAMQVANQILGGSGSSRLFQELREKRGLTYGAYSGLDSRKLGGHFTLATSVRNDVAEEALGVIEEQIALLRRTPPEGAELQAASRYLAGQFALSLAQGSELADWLTLGPLLGLSTDALQGWAGAIQRVSASDALDAAAQLVPASGRLLVVAGPLEQLRPALDGLCPTLTLRDPQGVAKKSLIGPDPEMGDDGRKLALQLWQSATAPSLAATARYAADDARAPAFRAAALANLAPTAAWKQVLDFGRKAKDWPDVARVLSVLLAKQLADPDLTKARQAKTLLLELADASQDKPEVSGEAGEAARLAVLAWAMGPLGASSLPEEIRAQLAARLDPGDLAKLGPTAAPTLDLWIAADVDRHRAANLLADAATPETFAALVRGYRKHLARGGLLDAADLSVLARSQSVDVTLMLLDGYANHERVTDRSQQRDQRALMLALRQQVSALRMAKNKDSLALQFDRLEAHLESMLQARFADDRYWAADLLIVFREGDGLRRVLERMHSDDHYRDPSWHDADPKQLLANLIRDAVSPLGKSALPRAISALSAKNPMGKVLAVAIIKQLGDDGALAALRTNADETDVSMLLALPEPVAVRELCRSAVEVRKLWREAEAAHAAGTISAKTVERYKRASSLVFHLTDKPLRVEIDRLVQEDAARDPDPEPPAPEPTAEQPKDDAGSDSKAGATGKESSGKENRVKDAGAKPDDAGSDAEAPPAESDEEEAE